MMISSSGVSFGGNFTLAADGSIIPHKPSRPNQKKPMATISTLAGLKRRGTLQEDDEVVFKGKDRDGNNFSIVYNVEDSYLEFYRVIGNWHGGDAIFRALDITDRFSFCSQYYGYTADDGSWPYFRHDDFNAITKAVQAIYERLEGVKTKVGFMVSKKLDVKELDKVVMDQTDKEDIIATLKQHENAEKMFETWGLGEIIEYGRGMTFMFHGGPGTGKTWCANCIAKALGTELLVVGSAEIQTQEPGGANRNIKNAFKNAQDEGKVLLLDECDSLITNRGDVGMILASEINTLLTEIERFEGVCILATNRIETLDEALERRLALITEFPDPDFDSRVKLWEKLLPKKMPVGNSVKPKSLAEHVLTGGHIKNIVLQAARNALAKDQDKVLLKDFENAINKMSKSKGLMGSKSSYRQSVRVGSGKSRSVKPTIQPRIVKGDVSK